MTGFALNFTREKADFVFASFDQGRLPGVAVGVAIDGRPVYRRGFGLANMQLPLLLSPAVRMRLGSTTKHMACAAFLLLCDEGRASLDDEIGRHLPGLHRNVTSITMRELMAHVSGLFDIFDLTWIFNGVDTAIQSTALAGFYGDTMPGANAPRGATWSYNNGGYLLLSLAIEAIAGADFETVLRTRLFEPIGMYDTEVRRSERGFAANCATLHASAAGGGFEQSLFFGTEFLGEGVAGFVSAAIGYLALSVSPNLWTALAGVIVAHAGMSVIWVVQTLLVQLQTEDRFRGRVFSADFASMVLLMALSTHLAGIAADTGADPRSIATVVGFIALVPAGIWLAFAMPLWRHDANRVEPLVK